MIKVFSQTFIPRGEGGERVKPIITIFPFKILWVFFTKLTLFGGTVGSNSNTLMELFLFSKGSPPYFFSPAWQLGEGETHVTSWQQQEAFWLVSRPHSFFTSVVGLNWFLCTCLFFLI